MKEEFAQVVVDELGNSFSMVAIAGYYGPARVCLVYESLEVCKNDLPWVQSWTRGILLSHSQQGYLCLGGYCIP